MALTLVVNAGSTSIKYALFDGEERVLAVQYDKKGDGCTRTVGDVTTTHDASFFDKTVPDMRTMLAGKKIHAYGFRVVHGGHILDHTVRIDEKIISGIEEAAELAPLHNYTCLALIKGWRDAEPGAPLYAVFDTAFHRTIPVYASTYDIPERFRNRYHIKRYGFHGISCQSSLRHVEELLGTLPARIIICHLGGGCSITAVRDGKSVDTSMGFSPLEGLMMASRTGDIDSGAVFHMEEILRREGLSYEEADTEAQRLLQKEGGLKAIAGTDSMQEVLARCEKGDTRAELALDMFVYHVQKYIGAYTAILGGLDALIFTGGIGSNAEPVRTRCASVTSLPAGAIFALPAKEDYEIVLQIRQIAAH